MIVTCTQDTFACVFAGAERTFDNPPVDLDAVLSAASSNYGGQPTIRFRMIDGDDIVWHYDEATDRDADYERVTG